MVFYELPLRVQDLLSGKTLLSGLVSQDIQVKGEGPDKVEFKNNEGAHQTFISTAQGWIP